MLLENLLKILKNGKITIYILFTISICIYSIILIIYELKNTYCTKREEYSLLSFDSKRYPNFFTKFGPIPTSYRNTCYINEKNKDGVIMDLTLKDFYIASAYRPYQVSGQTNDICSYKSIEKIIEKGARFHYLDIWSSNPLNIYDTVAYPIVRNKTLMGYDNTGYSLKFDEVCNIYKKHSWSGTQYPLILYLNLENTVSNNRFVQKKIAQILWDKFKGRFVGAEYSFAKKNIGDISIKKTFNNIIIITNIYPIDGSLQELINGVISNTIQNNGRLDILSKKDIAYTTDKKGNQISIINTPINTEDIVNSNKTKIGIYIPGDDAKTVFNIIEPMIDLIQIPYYEPHIKLGYNIVAINYQKPGIERDSYIDFFKEASFKLKDDAFRSIPCPKPIINSQNIKASYSPRTINKYNGYFEHSF